MVLEINEASDQQDISEPSSIESGIAQTSYQENNCNGGFSFSVPSEQLKASIFALADPELNPEKLGLMQVCPGGFEITVYGRDQESGEVFGFLSLKSSGLINFVCTRPMTRMLELVGIATFLETNAGDGDIVNVFNVDASDILSFTLIRADGNFSIDIPFSNAAPITQFPIFSYGFNLDIPTGKLRPILNHLLEMIPGSRPAIISMDIDTFMNIRTGSTYEVKVKERKIVWLMFPYWESLKKASTLADVCTLRLATLPENSAVLRFDLQELGDFMYLKHATAFHMIKDLPSMATFRPLFPR